MNKKVGELPTRGPWSKFIIDDPKDPNGEKIVGKLSIEWGEHLLTGIACDLSRQRSEYVRFDSEVKGKSEPYSLTEVCRWYTI